MIDALIAGTAAPYTLLPPFAVTVNVAGATANDFVTDAAGAKPADPA